MSAPILSVENVSKRFGGVVANDAVSLAVPEGAIIGLIGPNGSGKSTLFGSIVGFHPVDGGSVRFRGEEITRYRVPKIARMGLVRTFQQTHIYGQMSCLANMLISIPQRQERFLASFRRPKGEEIERAESLLASVGLWEKRQLAAGELSFGQQKLLEFAMALMCEPRLLLLDEPTAGINPTLINGLVAQLRRANAELGITLLVIEHNMRVIMNLADHLYCMAHGRILAEGDAEAIRADQRVIDAYLGAQ